MTNPSNVDLLAIIAVVTGRATGDDQLCVDSWTNADPANAALLARLREVHAVLTAAGHADIDARMQQLHTVVDAHVARAMDPPRHELMGPRITPSASTRQLRVAARYSRSASGWHFRGWATGAAALGIITLTWFGLHRKTSPASDSSAILRHYATVAGQRATITLADGSRIRMGPSTTVDVVAGYGGVARTVRLRGNAFFDVATNQRAPFVVRAGRVTAEVLGTEFNVRAYPGDARAEISVQSGKIALVGGDTARRGTTPRLVLTAGMVAITDSSGIHMVPTAMIDDYTGGPNGHLVFRQTPVRDVITELARVYDADIRITDTALAQRTVTWTIAVEQRSLDGVLDALTDALSAHVSRSGHTLTIVPGIMARQRRAQPFNSSNSERYYGR